MISDEGLPEYKLMRFSAIGALASVEEVEMMAKELLAHRKARDGWKLVPVISFPSQWAAGQKAFDSAGMNKVDAVYKAMVAAAPEVRALQRCAAARDGECNHAQCPQLRDGEPENNGRHCPIDNWDEDD